LKDAGSFRLNRAWRAVLEFSFLNGTRIDGDSPERVLFKKLIHYISSTATSAGFLHFWLAPFWGEVHDEYYEEAGVAQKMGELVASSSGYIMI
jgi:hypothetical protein